MRLPNGFGSVHKMPGHRRNPWRARKTVGWVPVDEDGNEVKPYSRKAISTKQKYLTIGYYPTRADAITALAAYNNDQTFMPKQTKKKIAPTFAEIFDKWSAQHFKTIGLQSARVITSAYRHIDPIFLNRPIDGFTTDDLDQYMKDLDASDIVKSRIRRIIRQTFDFAEKKDIISRNPSRNMDVYAAPATKVERKVFTSDELEKVAKIDHPLASAVIIACYTGWRPSELVDLKREDIDLEQMTMRGGMKTKAGKNRLVPIHPAIRSLVKKQYEAGSGTYLFPVSYDTYLLFYRQVEEATGVHHTPHDTRHTFITAAKQSDLDPMIIKRIVGHSISDITERVYTHRSIQQLHDEMSKLRIM